VNEAYKDELFQRFELDPSRRVGSLSKGNRQKVALIAALMSQPDVLLLDEPSAGLDPLMEAEFQRTVRDAASRGQTVFLSSHILDEVEDVCGRVALLRAGRLVEVGSLDSLRQAQKGVTVIDVMFEGRAPSFANVPGVVSEEPDGAALRLSVSGSPQAVLAELGRQRVVSIQTREPDLEQVFLGLYGVPDPR
jgi:ABC-2 type transport system ATP-binding protein